MNPILTEIYNDNDGLSHGQIVDVDTGVILFSYDPEELALRDLILETKLEE